MAVAHIETQAEALADTIVAMSIAARDLRNRVVSAGAHECVRLMYDKMDEIEQLLIEAEAHETALAEDMGAK